MLLERARRTTRSIKIKTYKLYDNLDTDFDVDAINEKIRKIDSLKFD
jgi:hypothetical protein